VRLERRESLFLFRFSFRRVVLFASIFHPILQTRLISKFIIIRDIVYAFIRRLEGSIYLRHHHLSHLFSYDTTKRHRNHHWSIFTLLAHFSLLTCHNSSLLSIITLYSLVVACCSFDYRITLIPFQQKRFYLSPDILHICIPQCQESTKMDL
jgi:hypothetical protein